MELAIAMFKALLFIFYSSRVKEWYFTFIQYIEMVFAASYWLPEVSGDAGDMKRQNEVAEVSKSWARLELPGIRNAQPTA